MVMVFVGYSTILMDSGFGQALIQKKDIQDVDYSSVFWLNFCLGVVLFLALYFFSGLIALFYNNEKLELITKVVAIQFVFASLVVVHKVKIQKELRFKLLSALDTIATFIGCIVAVVFAYIGFGYWSLVFQNLAVILTSCILYFKFANWRPSLSFSKVSIANLSRFSIDVFLNKSIYYWTGGVDKIIIGKYLGESALGVYKNASAVIFRPLSAFLGVLSRVLFPSLSIIQDDYNKLRSVYIDAIASALWGVVPILSLIYFLIGPLVEMYLGADWIDAIDIVKILCLSLSPIAIIFLSETIYLVIDKSRLMLKVNIFYRLLLVAGFFVGFKWGVKGIAFSMFFSYLIRLVLDLYFINKFIGLNFLASFRKIMPILIIGSFSFLVPLLINFYLIDNTVLYLIFIIFAYLSSYLTLSFVFNIRIFRIICEFFYNKLRAI